MGRHEVRRRAVFLDRDGVLNRAIIRNGKPYPPSNLDELEIAPGVSEGCQDLHTAGFLMIMVTNQPDVSRGSQTRHGVEIINRTLADHLLLDDVKVCFHDDPDGCNCRKPKPGLLLAAAAEWNIDLSTSFMVGDRWKDIEAGRRAGCKTVLIQNSYAEQAPRDFDKLAGNFSEAVFWILNKNGALEREQQ